MKKSKRGGYSNKLKKPKQNLCAASNAVFAEDLNGAPPIHWSKSPFDNTALIFKNGKSFCAKKFVGRKTCIPAMNNTTDQLTFSTADYDADNAPAHMVVTLMGKGALPTTLFTVQDTDEDGKVNTVYSGSANNREGIVCNADDATKAVTCAPWK
jgi:hypothetical protein